MPTNSPAINGSQSTMALHPNISATGVRGFLMWMKTDPTMAKVYQNIAPQLPALLSTYGFAGVRRGLGALGQCCDSIYCSGGAMYCGYAASCAGSCNVSDSITASAPTDSTNSSSLMNSLSSLLSVGGAVGSSVLNAQLAQAAAGRPPLALTVPTTAVASSMSSTTLLVLLGGGALLLVMMSGKKGSAS